MFGVERAVASVRRLHDTLRQAGQLSMVVVALAIGLLGGYCAVGFRLFIRLVNELVWHQGPYTLEYIAGLPVWWKLAVPTAGGLVVGFIIHYFSKEAKGHGVPEVMEAVALRSGRMRPRVVAAKLVASGISIGTGGSVGREGPMVQIGAALGSTIGQWLKIDQRRLRTLVGCGAAAGIAATFNAPVAGALFAVEILLGDFGVAQFSPMVISSVAATVVSHHYFGDFPAFEVPAYWGADGLAWAREQDAEENPFWFTIRHGFADGAYPMWLSTGRSFAHYHSGSMTRVSPSLHQEVPEGYVEISPVDAKAMAIKDGERVKVSSRRGEIQIKARISGKVNRGVVFIPFHFAETAANVLTNSAYDPVAKIPEYKVCAVKVEKLAA